MISGDDNLLTASDDESGGGKLLDEKNGTGGGVASKLVIGSGSTDGDEPPASSSDTHNGHRSDPDNVHDAIFKDGSIEINIRAYEKRGEGINAYLVYKIETKVENIPGYTKDRYEVWRRFSDFLGLREKLQEKYQQKGIVVPSAPEKSLSALTKTKLTATNDDATANDVAEKRTRYLQRFLRRLTRHPRLVTDCDLRDFLTMDAPLPKATNTSALSGSSMKKMFKSLGDALTKIAYPMDENDRWYEQVHGQVEELEEMLTRLHAAIEGLVNYRRELSQSDEQHSKALSMLASCEENTALARTLSKLAETHENLSVIERAETDVDAQVLSENLQEQLQLIHVLKEVFYERVKAWQNWQEQQRALTKKREIKARLDLAGKTDKAAQCKEELKDYENKVDLMEKEFATMSKLIRSEYDRVAEHRRVDMRSALIEYFEAQLANEQKVLECWEKFAPETKTIST